jgi:DNA-binding NarL/FixJ family response regulator
MVGAGPGRGDPVAVVLVGADPGTFPGASDLGVLPGVRLVARAESPRRAPRLVDDAHPDVVVAGLGPDREPVLAVVAELSARFPGVPVLAVAPDPARGGSDPARDVLAAVRAGVAGFVVVTADGVALADALRRTAAGEAVFSPGLAEIVLEGRSRPADAAEARARLTEREADVLRLVVEGLTARQIATRLVLSPRTVENHIQHVLRKLGVPNRAALVRYAIENGLA